MPIHAREPRGGAGGGAHLHTFSHFCLLSKAFKLVSKISWSVGWCYQTFSIQVCLAYCFSSSYYLSYFKYPAQQGYCLTHQPYLNAKYWPKFWYKMIPNTENMIPKLYSTRTSLLGMRSSRSIFEYFWYLMIPQNTLVVMTNEDLNSTLGMHVVTLDDSWCKRWYHRVQSV